MTASLTIFLAWYSGSLVWSALEEPAPITKPKVVVDPSNLEKQDRVYDLNALIRAQLFGSYVRESKIKAPAKNLSEIPRIKLNLKLVGLVASTLEEKSLAIIGNRGTQAVYGIGEKIDGTQVTLRYVLSDRVILENGGRDETLMLEGVDFNQSTASDFNSKTNEKKSAPTSSGLSSVRADILKNPQSLLKYITLSQERNGKEILGYRLGPGSDKRLFEESGLQRGDVATSINNVDLTDPSKMNLIWRNLSDASEISLTVLRNGQTHEINISL